MIHGIPTSFFRRLALAMSLAASAVMPARAATEESISFHALCFSPGSATQPEFFVASGSGREKVEIPITYLGGPFKASVREGGLVDFFTTAQDQRPAISVKLPATGRDHLLLVFIPDGKSYQASAMPLPATGFSGGTTLAINCGHKEISIRHGAKAPTSIKPGANSLLTLPAGYKDPMLPVQIFTRNDAGEWEIAQSTRWAVDKRSRSYLFIYEAPQTGRLGMHGVPERMPDDNPG